MFAQSYEFLYYFESSELLYDFAKLSSATDRLFRVSYILLIL